LCFAATIVFMWVLREKGVVVYGGENERL